MPPKKSVASSSSASEKQDSYEPGAYVLAKLRGHPWWPGFICKGLESNSKVKYYRVWFYGTEEEGRVSANYVMPYNEETKKQVDWESDLVLASNAKRKRRDYEKQRLAYEQIEREFSNDIYEKEPEVVQRSPRKKPKLSKETQGSNKNYQNVGDAVEPAVPPAFEQAFTNKEIKVSKGKKPEVVKRGRGRKSKLSKDSQEKMQNSQIVGDIVGVKIKGIKFPTVEPTVSPAIVKPPESPFTAKDKISKEKEPELVKKTRGRKPKPKKTQETSPNSQIVRDIVGDKIKFEPTESPTTPPTIDKPTVPPTIVEPTVTPTIERPFTRKEIKMSNEKEPEVVKRSRGRKPKLPKETQKSPNSEIDGVKIKIESTAPLTIVEPIESPTIIESTALLIIVEPTEFPTVEPTEPSTIIESTGPLTIVESTERPTIAEPTEPPTIIEPTESPTIAEPTAPPTIKRRYTLKEIKTCRLCPTTDLFTCEHIIGIIGHGERAKSMIRKLNDSAPNFDMVLTESPLLDLAPHDINNLDYERMNSIPELVNKATMILVFQLDPFDYKQFGDCGFHLIKSGKAFVDMTDSDIDSTYVYSAVIESQGACYLEARFDDPVQRVYLSGCYHEKNRLHPLFKLFGVDIWTGNWVGGATKRLEEERETRKANALL